MNRISELKKQVTELKKLIRQSQSMILKTELEITTLIDSSRKELSDKVYKAKSKHRLNDVYDIMYFIASNDLCTCANIINYMNTRLSPNKLYSLESIKLSILNDLEATHKISKVKIGRSFHYSTIKEI